MADEISLSTLLVAVAKDAFFDKLIDFSEALGLDTETWTDGDPTLTLYDAVAQILEQDEGDIVEALKSGFIALASGVGLTLAARYLRNVERYPATYATCTVRLTNAGGAPFTFEVDDLTFRNSTTKKTYRNKTGGTLVGGPATTLDLSVEADEAGSDSSSGVGDIDELVVALPNVSVANTTAAVGDDEESDESLRERADAKLGELSAGGPKLAYDSVSRNKEKNGNVTVTRVRTIHESDTNECVVYLADASGAVDEPTRAAVEEGLETWANPGNVDLTVLAASNVTQAITYELWVYDDISMTEDEIETTVETLLGSEFAKKKIGGDVIPPATSGKIYVKWIEAVILRAVEPHGFRVAVTIPAADLSLTIGQVAVLGAITPTINLVSP